MIIVNNGVSKNPAYPYKSYNCGTCKDNGKTSCINYRRINSLLQMDGFKEAQEIASSISHRLGLTCHSSIRRLILHHSNLRDILIEHGYDPENM